jgi:Flp pilus assembly pilin Flp
MRRAMLQLVQREDGISFIECALVGALAAVVAGMAFLALSKRT